MKGKTAQSQKRKSTSSENAPTCNNVLQSQKRKTPCSDNDGSNDGKIEKAILDTTFYQNTYLTGDQKQKFKQIIQIITEYDKALPSAINTASKALGIPTMVLSAVFAELTQNYVTKVPAEMRLGMNASLYKQLKDAGLLKLNIISPSVQQREENSVDANLEKYFSSYSTSVKATNEKPKVLPSYVEFKKKVLVLLKDDYAKCESSESDDGNNVVNMCRILINFGIYLLYCLLCDVEMDPLAFIKNSIVMNVQQKDTVSVLSPLPAESWGGTID